MRGGAVELPLFEELKRRRVFRALIAWGIAAFAVLQIIEPVMHGLHWPDAVLSYVVVALAIGFPVVVALAWIFDVKEGRIERAPSGNLHGLRLAAVVLAVGAVAAAPGVLYYFVLHRPAPAESAPTSVAVLPFVNMSSDKETDYFSDGITEELINALVNVPGLRVASRTAVFAFKGKALAIQQMGAELNVATLLEGSVRRQGNELRITAQLTKVSDGYHLWSKSFDRELNGIFAVEDEIARAIAATLQRSLVGVRHGTSDVQAYNLFLQGRFFSNKRTGGALRKAAGFFEQAILQDPNYALAYDGLADVLALRVNYDGEDSAKALPAAKQAAHRALELDPTLGEAHASLGMIAAYEREWATATTEFRKAIELSPSYAMAYKWLGNTFHHRGHLKEAREAFEKALALDPLSQVTNTNVGESFLDSHDYVRAEQQFRKTLEIDPSFDMARRLLIHALIQEGDGARTLSELDRLSGAHPTSRALVFARLGRREEALALLRDQEKRPQPEEFRDMEIAATWIALGSVDSAFATLRGACKDIIPSDLFSPLLDPLRGDPRFTEILRCARVN